MNAAAAVTQPAQDRRFRGSLLLRGLRAAWPSYAGPLAAQAVAFLFAIALIAIFREVPSAFASVGVLWACLSVATAIGTAGVDSGLRQVYADRPKERDDLLVTALVVALLLSVAAVAVIQFVPGVAEFLMGKEGVRAGAAPFLWKAPALAYLAVVVAAARATNSLRATAAIEAAEAVAAALLAVVGALVAGLQGLFWGSLAGSILVAGAVGRRSGRGRFRAALLVDLLRVGWRRAALALTTAAVPLVVLRAMPHWRPSETGILVAAIGLLLPLAVLPEVLAQALHPTGIGVASGRGRLRRVRVRLEIEIAAAPFILIAVVLPLGAWLLPLVGHGQYAPVPGIALVLVPGLLAQVAAAATGATVVTRERWAPAALAASLSFATAAGLNHSLGSASVLTGAFALSIALMVRALALLVLTDVQRSTKPTGGRSLDDVRTTALPGSFPSQVLAGNPSTLSLFSAAFLGRNDCIHLADGGVTDALLVDLDDEKLSQMRAIYPDTWKFAAGDAYVVAECLRAAGETFDLVVVDGWTGEAQRMLTKNLPLWLSLSRRWTLLMAPRPWFKAQGIEPTAAAVEAWVRRVHGLDVTIEELHFRADWEGGVWWIVVRAGDPLTRP